MIYRAMLHKVTSMSQYIRMKPNGVINIQGSTSPTDLYCQNGVQWSDIQRYTQAYQNRMASNRVIQKLPSHQLVPGHITMGLVKSFTGYASLSYSQDLTPLQWGPTSIIDTNWQLTTHTYTHIYTHLHIHMCATERILQKTTAVCHVYCH